MFLFRPVLSQENAPIVEHAPPLQMALATLQKEDAPRRPVSDAEKRRRLLVSVYRAETSVREQSGKNDGERVEEYLHYTGLGKGNPWCAAFVCWALGRAGIENPRSAYCPDLFKEAKLIWAKNGRLQRFKVKSPAGGDVFGIYFPEKKRIAHTGFVDQWQDQFVITVEGNTNEAGGREGDGVYRKRRPLRSLYMIVRWWG